METVRARVSLHRWAALCQTDDVLTLCMADLGGMAAFVSSGQTVVIKPNITANAPAESGGTTHLELVEAIVRQVQRCRPGLVVVAEGTGAFGPTHETAFPSGGWREMAARTGVALHNLDAGPFVEVTRDTPRYPHPLPFSRLIHEADVFITVPCLKTHSTADYTVALKNAFGQTPQWKRTEIHRQYLLEESLVDLNRIRRPDLCVVDGYDGAEGIAGGTDFERPAGARLMLVGADPVAVDVVSRRLMAFTARTRYLQWAIADGLGIGDLEHIDVLGDPISDCARRFMSPADELSLLLPMVTLHDGDACSGCRVAAVSALSRFRYQRLVRPLDLVYGAKGEVPEVGPDALIIGDCAARHAHLGTYMPGCPVAGEAIVAAMEAAGAVCRECRQRAIAALGSVPEETLDVLRVVASGIQAHCGRRVERDQAAATARWHLQLLVGDCMKRYAFIVNERAAQFGLDPERDVLWLRGCPVEDETLAAAVQRLQRRLAEVQAASAETP